MHIAVKEGCREKVIEQLGSAHTEAELAALMEFGRHRIAPDQLALDLPPVPPAPQPAPSGPANGGAVVVSKPLGPVAGRSARSVYPPGTGRGGRW